MTAFRVSRLTFPLPREHGTWAWLLLPLVVGGGAAGRASLPVVLLALAAVSAFLARAPVELALRRDAQRAANAGWTALFGAVAAGGVVALLAQYERWWLLPLGVPVIAGPMVVISSRALRLRWRALGELLVVVCLSALAPAAHYSAVGAVEATGLWLWLLAALYGGSSVVYVRMLLERRDPSGDGAASGRRLAVFVYHAALVALVLAVSLAGDAPWLVAIAFAPLLAKVAYRFVRPPDHLNLPKTGLFEASQAVLFAMLIIAAYRAG